MKSKIKEYVSMWEGRCYPEGIPDEVPFEINDKVPNYKKIVWAILKNDHPLTSLGFTAPKSEMYGIYKRIELSKRNNMEVKQTLTELEKNVLRGLQRNPFGLLRGYNGTYYRFLDENINPIANLERSKINSLIEKGYLELLPGNKFKIL